MSDVAFVVLTIAVFGVLALVLQGSRAAVSAANAGGPGAGRRADRSSWSSPCSSRSGSDEHDHRGHRHDRRARRRAGAGVPCRSATTCTASSLRPRHLRVERGDLPAGRRRPRRRAVLGRLRAQRAGVLARSRSCSCTLFQRVQDAPAGCQPGLRRRCRRRWPGTPRSASSPTRTGSRTRVSPRWATWCRWPAWRCRTSSRPRSASRSRSRWCAASPASRTDQLGNFWVDLTRIVPADPAADRGRRSRSCSIAGGHDPEPLRRHRRHHARPARTQTHHRRAGRQPGGHQGARHQRRRLLQRQLARTRSRTRPAGRTGSRSSCCW